MYKIHRQNHDFQIAYFLVGSCHTPDGAYAMLQGLKEERLGAINNYHVQQLKIKAEIIKANQLLLGSEADKLIGEATLLEIEYNKALNNTLFNAATDELNFINNCIDIVQPYRQYKDLSDEEAYEKAQRLEWKLELMYRAENSILTIGVIQTDDYSTMRKHPDFETDILPHIKNVIQHIERNGTNNIDTITISKFNISKLLEQNKLL